jgi:diacylglycerol kinase family enzyme
VSGFGFDGEVMDRVTKMRDGHIDYFDYASPLWQTFWSHTFHPIQVELDGQVIFNGPGMVIVGNVARYALGLFVLRHADVSDGLLDVCVLKCQYRPHLLKHYLTILFKRHTKCGDVIYRQGKHVKVTSPSRKIKTQVDGDPGPPLPADIDITPGAIRVMVPQEFKPEGTWRRLLRLLG